jgi:diadenosine tetraphosphate (Ap4A) HIT family hydrolase
MDARCPLCAAAGRDDILAANEHAVAIFDAFPVNPGHALIISRRHVANLFDLSPTEQTSLWALLPTVKGAIDVEHSPAGYNVGANVGVAAGQTVMHVHVHIIPRFTGDVDDPSGGVRVVIPERGNYRRPGHIPRARA